LSFLPPTDKAEYAALIRDVEALKHEMEVVTTKVERAESLMTSLSHESERWAKSRYVFTFQILLCIAFVDSNVAYLTICQKVRGSNQSCRI
jgi:hypothetical protein